MKYIAVNQLLHGDHIINVPIFTNQMTHFSGHVIQHGCFGARAPKLLRKKGIRSKTVEEKGYIRHDCGSQVIR